MSDPWFSIGFFLVLLGLGGVLVRLVQRRCLPPPERVRKLLHVIAGVVGLGLPSFFTSLWPVAVLTGIVLLGLLVVRGSAALRSGIGGIIHGVSRHSFGDLCFPLGTCLVFALAGDDRLRFTVPMLVLTLADPAAALVGLRHGRHRYRVAGAAKSLEGSAAFFAIAFACTAIPFLGTGRRLPPLVALTSFALTVTLVEALGPRGFDNLLIPTAGILAFDGWLMRAPTWPLVILD